MELEKDGDVFSESLLEAKLFQDMANHCRSSRGLCSVVGIVAGAPVTEGASVMRRFLPELLRVAPLARSVREALWRRPTSSFINGIYWKSLEELATHNLTLDLLV